MIGLFIFVSQNPTTNLLNTANQQRLHIDNWPYLDQYLVEHISRKLTDFYPIMKAIVQSKWTFQTVVSEDASNATTHRDKNKALFSSALFFVPNLCRRDCILERFDIVSKEEISFKIALKRLLRCENPFTTQIKQDHFKNNITKWNSRLYYM